MLCRDILTVQWVACVMSRYHRRTPRQKIYSLGGDQPYRPPGQIKPEEDGNIGQFCCNPLGTMRWRKLSINSSLTRSIVVQLFQDRHISPALQCGDQSMQSKVKSTFKNTMVVCLWKA